MNVLQRLGDRADSLLDPITSYRLVLYFLYVIAGWAIIFAALNPKSLPFSWWQILVSGLLLMTVCRSAGYFLSRSLDIPRNFESDYITALILLLMLSPATSQNGYLIICLAGSFAIASKYILVVYRRHIFNPAALGAFLTGAVFHQYASWWIGTSVLAPVILVGGILLARKIKRFLMIIVFALVFGFFLHQHFDGAPPLHTVWLAATGTPVMFFAFVMLTEPLSSPSNRKHYIPYAILVALLYSFNKLHLSPEEALLIGNIFSFIVMPYKRIKMNFVGSHKEAEGIYSFAFHPKGKLNFLAGQYMEWTIPFSKSDSRGNRRYLTLSSSPTEDIITFTIKIPPEKTSSFKSYLIKMSPGDEVLATQVAGSFTPPLDTHQKLAFLAGGVGVTPFRSIIKYLDDKNKSSDIKLLYTANDPKEFAFKEVWTHAANVGVHTSLTTSKISEALIKQRVPDYKERLFYISGPYGFVKAARESLFALGLSRRQIITDYFPGYG